MYITNGWDQQLFPEWDSIDNRFLEVNETLDQVIIHPNSATYIAMLPAWFLSFPSCEARGPAYL